MPKPDGTLHKYEINALKKEKFVRGRPIKLTGGVKGIFLETCSSGDNAWVLVGGMNGPKKIVTIASLIPLNLGIDEIVAKNKKELARLKAQAAKDRKDAEK